MRTHSLLLLVLVQGCLDPAIAESTSGTSSTGSPDAATESSPTGASASETSTGSTSSGGVADSSSSSTGEVLDGLGCNVTPRCEGGTLEAGIRVTSAEELAMLEGVTEITGTLEIAESDLECLDALACLQTVGGDIRVLGNPVLRSTAGLAGIEELGSNDISSASGSVIVSQNEELEVLEGFDQLRRINGGVTVWQNPSLREVVGFEGMRRLELLSINSNPLLESLAGLHALERLEDCNVSQNATLCISEVFEVCGDVDPPADGVTNNNDDAC